MAFSSILFIPREPRKYPPGPHAPLAATLMYLDACERSVVWAHSHPELQGPLREALPAAWAACPEESWLLWFSGALADKYGPWHGSMHTWTVEMALHLTEQALGRTGHFRLEREIQELLTKVRWWCHCDASTASKVLPSSELLYETILAWDKESQDEALNEAIREAISAAIHAVTLVIIEDKNMVAIHASDVASSAICSIAFATYDSSVPMGVCELLRHDFPMNQIRVEEIVAMLKNDPKLRALFLDESRFFGKVPA